MFEIIKIAAKKSDAKNEASVNRIRQTELSRSLPLEQIMLLQSTIGNQTVQRLMKSGALQAKLRIGAPGEQEAGRGAEQVMRIHDKEEEEIHTKEAKGKNPELMHEVENSISVMRGSGQPLPENTRAFYEPRFNHDFSGVRIHTDTKAAESARAVNAKAYTSGHDVVFGAGQYAPNIKEGQQLIAHELTHVVQQEKASPKYMNNIQLKPEVRGMVTERLEGRPPRAGEWRVIESALEGARSMVHRIVNRMDGIHNILLPGSDPRFYSESRLAITDLFSRHFKSRRAIDALEVREYYQFILNALNSLRRNGFRVVPDAVAQRETEGDVIAYVYGRSPVIYLAEYFFGELQEIQSTARVTMGSRIISPEQKARILIHETAHFRLGVQHRGGIFGFDVVNCSQGLPVRTSSDAMGNAFVYDHFAYCASR